MIETVEDTLAEILPEAFAVVKDTCRRLIGRDIVVTGQPMTWDMIPYDVQLIGAIALHRGKVEEMATGEGKTLVATMPLYLNALAGRGAHLVTVNTYLAQRDAEWMGTIFEFLGLTVDVIDLYDPGSPERQAAYRSDITYGTNNEFGFDYLRDNMVHQLGQRVQRDHAYAIIDEVDSILIDEARTPLIISGPVGSDTSTPFKHYNSLVGSLYKKQLRIANEMVSEAEKHLADDEQFEAGEKLLAVRRGAPKHRKFMKLLADDPSLQTLVNKVEADFMREKRLHEVDEMLYFAMDEKGHNVHLSDRGLDELSPSDPEGVHGARSLRRDGRGREQRDALDRAEAGDDAGARSGVCRQESEDPRHPPAPEGVYALPQRREVHHWRERRSRHRRRVHRSSDGRAAVERWAPPGRGGEGGSRDPGRDAGRSPPSPSRTTSACTTSSPA